jgi:Flp pilus assembly protein TadG
VRRHAADVVELNVRRVRWQRDRGAAAVEFALVLPILLLFVMGTIEWGWFFFTHQRVVNAAREGARAGTLVPPPPNGTTAQMQSEAVDAANSYLTAVGLTATGVDANPAFTMDDGSLAVRVVITYPYTSLTQFPGISSLIPSQFQYISAMRWQDPPPATP